jgi:class 3 adenylate cyclase
MAENATQRKLTAIMSADVKGYSKLMGDDDESTVNTITAYRKIISELIQKHRGRVVDTHGDNVLAEFESTVNAVKAQLTFKTRWKQKIASSPTIVEWISALVSIWWISFITATGSTAMVSMLPQG